MHMIFHTLLLIAGVAMLLMAAAFGTAVTKLPAKKARAHKEAFIIGSVVALVLGLVGLGMICVASSASYWLLVLSPIPGFVGMFLNPRNEKIE